MSGVILVFLHRADSMSLLIRNLVTFSPTEKHARKHESEFVLLITLTVIFFDITLKRNLVVALKEVSIRGDFHSTGILIVFCFTTRTHFL